MSQLTQYAMRIPEVKCLFHKLYIAEVHHFIWQLSVATSRRQV